MAQAILSEDPELLQTITVFVVPRVAVDGAEFCVATGAMIRSRLWDVKGELKTPNTSENLQQHGHLLSFRCHDAKCGRMSVSLSAECRALLRPHSLPGGCKRQARRVHRKHAGAGPGWRHGETVVLLRGMPTMLVHREFRVFMCSASIPS